MLNRLIQQKIESRQNKFIVFLQEEKLKLSENASGDADGLYLLPGGIEIEDNILEKTEKVLDKIRDDLEELTSEVLEQADLS